MDRALTTDEKGKGIGMKRDYLTTILTTKKQEIAQLIQADREAHSPLNKILYGLHAPSAHFSKTLRREKLSVIAEVKRRSPSAGEIGSIHDPAELALEYCRAGASAISVLTDSKGFGGSLADLESVVHAVHTHYPDVSVLRKDFILHPLQLAETRAAGADAVLLIACALGKELKPLLREAARLGLEVLTEVHDHSDLEAALEAQAAIIGINHRNLSTFEIDLEISAILKPLIPGQILAVAESGIYDSHTAQQMRARGFDAILVGEALVKARNRAQLIAQMQGDSDES
jgi:indole-3-glycerol phosphate synthase